MRLLFLIIFLFLVVKSKCLPIKITESDKSKLAMNRVYSQMIKKIIQNKDINNKYEDVRILKIDPEIENFNIYTDSDFSSYPYDGNEDEENNDGGGGDGEVSEEISCSLILENLKGKFDEPNLPFPQFLNPLLTIFSRELNNTKWKLKKENQLKCLVEVIKNLEYHPCDHKNNSCVIITLPKQRILIGCMNSKTGELIPPKNFDGTEQELPFLEFQVSSGFPLNHDCKNDEINQPICQHTNLFFKEKLIIEDTSCCCKSPYCVNVIFDQHGENFLPYIHLEMNENDHINQPIIPSTIPTIIEPTNNSIDNPDTVQESQNFAEAQTWSGFDWSFSPIETFVIICVVLLILIIVITLGLWYVHEKEQVQDARTNIAIQRTTDVFDLESDSDLLFEAKHAGRSFH